MVANMMGCFEMAKSGAKELTNGLISQFTSEIGLTTILRAKENIRGLMAEFTKENGKKINCTAEESIAGQTDVNTMVNTKMTKNMVSERTIGQMERLTKDSGSMANSTERPSLQIQRAAANWAYGKMENV